MKVLIGDMNIFCRSLETSLKFYNKVLGFEILEQDENQKTAHIRCRDRNFLLRSGSHLSQSGESYGDRSGLSFDIIVMDIEEFFKHCQQHKVDIVKYPSSDNSHFFIRDPDGLVIEVLHGGC